MEPLRADDPEVVGRAVEMARAGEGFALALSRSVPPARRELDRVIPLGTLRVRWDEAGGLRAVASSPRVALATRFRGQLEPSSGGGVLRGTARNRTHWLWRAILVPTVLAFAAVLVAAATEPVWALVGFAVLMLALCAAGWHWLGTVQSTAVTRGTDLYELAQALWDADQTSRTPADLGLPATPERPLTEAERELIRTAATRLRSGEAGSPAVLEDYHPLTSGEIAEMLEGFLDPPTAPPEAVDAARDVHRRLDG